MSLTLPAYNILLEEDDGSTTEHTVEIRHADQLRAELEGPKHGLTDISAAPMHYTGMWIWAACVRAKLTTEPYKVFKNRLLALEPVEDQEPVDPTQPEDATS